MYPPLDTNFVCLSFSECYPPGLIWLFGRFDFFFFLRLRFDVFLCSIQCHSQLVKWFLKFAVTIKVFTYHVRVHLTSRRETNVLVPVWSRLFERWMARSKLSAALLQRRRPRELAVQATIQLISVRETNCVIHWIEILCPPLYEVARSPLGGGTTGTR